MAKQKLPKGQGVTNTFTEVVRAKRESGQSAYESFFGSVKEKLREKTDVRQILPQGGLLTALFPQLKAFKAGPQPGMNSPTPTAAPSLSSASFDKIQINTSIAAKNSMVLPKIHQDFNLMRQNIAKLVKLNGGKAVTKVDKDFFKAKDVRAAYAVQVAEASPTPVTEEEGPKKPKGIAAMVAAVSESVKAITENIKSSIKEVVSSAIGKLLSGLKGALDLGKMFAKYGIRMLFPIMSSIVRWLISGAGLTVLLGVGFMTFLWWYIKNNTEWGAEYLKNVARQPKDFTSIPQPNVKQLKRGEKAPEPKRVGDQAFREEVERRAFEKAKAPFANTPNQIWAYTDEEKKNGQYNEQFLRALHTYRYEERDKLIAEMSKGALAIGDSLAKGLEAAGFNTNQATVGANPQTILKAIETNTKNNPKMYDGKTVVLSSGMSNVDVGNESQKKSALEAVAKQVQLLKGANATVTLMGVGPNEKLINANINGELSKIARDNGISFTGPLNQITSESFDTSKIHPTTKGYKDIGNYALSHAGIVPKANKSGEVVDSQSRNASDTQTNVTIVKEESTKAEQSQASNSGGSSIAATLDESIIELLGDND